MPELPAHPDAATIPLRYLRPLLRLARAQGCDINGLAQASGLSGMNLNVLPDSHPVSAGSYARLYLLLARALDDECFGFYPGRPMPCGSMALLCRLLIGTRNLAEAVDTSLRFFRLCGQLRGDLPIRHPATLQRDELAWLCHPPVADHQVADLFSRQNGIAGALSSWHRLLGWLIGRPLPLRAVSLRGPCSIRLDKFERIFRCPIHFDARDDALGIEPRWLESPVVRDATALAAFLPMAPYLLIGLRELDGARPLNTAERVLQLLRQHPSEHLPGLEQAAAQLGLTARSLRRQLAREGGGYQQLKDRFRRELACSHLTHSNAPIAEVARLAGFDEPSAFHRAFRRWTGSSPGSYRAQRRGLASHPQ